MGAVRRVCGGLGWLPGDYPRRWKEVEWQRRAQVGDPAGLYVERYGVRRRTPAFGGLMGSRALRCGRSILVDR